MVGLFDDEVEQEEWKALTFFVFIFSNEAIWQSLTSYLSSEQKVMCIGPGQ
jgi:hypothetical protein